MLSSYDLKYHCRTCFIKIENLNYKEDAKKCVSIANYPEVEQFIRTCMNKHNGGTTVDHRLNFYVPNLCCICLEKWQDFSTHYLLAVKTNEILRKILEKEEPFELVSEKIEEPNKVFLQLETSNLACDIEKYETISPFYPTSRSNTPLPDPQSEEALNDLQLSDAPDLDDTETLQSPKAITSDSDEVLSLEDAKEPLAKLIKSKQTKETLVKRTRTCRSKRKSKVNQASDTISENHLNEPNEHATKKIAYRCEPCKKFFYGSITYEGHIKRVHEGVKKAYQCKECDKAYSFPHNLAEHIASNHRKLTQDETLQILQCDHCNKPYKNKASLTQHLRNHHQDCSPDSKRIICDQCGFLAAHQMSLAQHIKNKHTEIEEIKCEQCSKVFKSQYYLKYHMMSFHNPMNIKPFKCPQCPMAFTRRPRLNIHIRTHLNYSERIKCDFEGCDVRFVKLSAKRRHMRLVHLKVKQHICDICGEAFGIKATLRHHRYIHTGEKPYKCNVCGQAFRQLTAMKTHRKMHADKEEAMAATTESDILSSLAQIDGGFEDSSNSFE